MPYNPNKMSAAPDTRQERESEQERPKKRARPGGATPEAARQLRAEDEKSRSMHIDELQKKLGVKSLKDPEAMLFALADKGETTIERLNDTQRFVEARQIQLQQEMMRATDPDEKAALQEKIEANSRLIFKIEDARHAIENAGAADRPEDASRILDGVLSRDRDISKGTEKAIASMEREQKQLEAELEALYAEIGARESGTKKGPGLLQRASFGLGNLMRRISSQQEQAQSLDNMSSRDLTLKRREIQQRLNQLEMNLINLRPPKQIERADTWTPMPTAEEEIPVTFEEEPETQRKPRVPRPMTAEEKAANPEFMAEQSRKAMKLIESKLSALEKRGAKIDSELAQTETEIKAALEQLKIKITPEASKKYKLLKKYREDLLADQATVAEQARELMRQMPAPLPQAPEVLGEEDIIKEEAPVELGAADIIEEEAPPTERMPRAPRPVSAEELAANPEYADDQARKTIKLIEAGLQKLEARKAKAEAELAKLKKNGSAAKREALEAELDKIAEESRKLMARYPKETPPAVLTEADILPEEAEAEEIKDEDIIESEEVSGVRRKPRVVPPPPDKAKRQKETAEEREKAEFQKKVAWAEKLLPGGQAATMNQEVLGQMGVNWGSANEQQRNFSVEYVFKAASVQEALNSGNDKAYERAKRDLQSFEKALGLVSSPYFEPAGRAGVGVTLESARAEQGRQTRRMTGVDEAARGRTRARRLANEAPPIEAVTTEYAEAQEAEEARRKAEQEEKLMAGARAAEEAIAKGKKVPEVPEHILQEAEIGKRMMVPMSIERTAAAVPKAKELWDLVAQTIDKLDKELEASGAKHRRSADVIAAANEPNMNDAATAYVMAMGRYLEAVNEPAPDYVIRAFGKRIEKMNKALGLAGNALVQSIMAERGNTYGKPVGRNFGRGKETTAQQARRAARI